MPRVSPSAFRSGALLAAVLAAYFVAAASAIHVFGESTPIWYSNAFVIVALVNQPLRVWPLYLAGAAVADAAAIALFGSGISPILAVADVLEIVLVAGGIHWAGGVPRPLFQGGQVLRVVAACLTGPVVSAALGGWIISSQAGIPFAPAWRTWYTASALGLLLVAPFILSWVDPQLRQRAFAEVRWRDAVMLPVAACVMVVLLQVERHEEVLFLTFPLLLAMTWTYGLPGATVGMVALTCSGIYETLHGRGALVKVALPLTSVHDQVAVLQLYLVAVLLSSLPLALLHARQRELSDEARRSSEARSEFLAAMSHEIRTPMTGVLGMLDLMSSEALTSSQQRYIDAMRSSGRHLLSIINDILDFSRIESGKLQVEEIDFSVSELLERLRSLAHPLAVERGVELEFEVELEVDVLLGDPLRLLQVLLNLVSNAIKFTARGRVTVSVAQHRDPDDPRHVVRFAVRDTGIGIEPAKLQMLFQPFKQADGSISREYGGTGLGLAISQRLVQAMGADISVSSVPHQGSTFSFALRLAAGDPRLLAAGDESPQAAAPPRRILVAEDVEINREILGAALRQRGHTVVFAPDGEQALDRLMEQDFDLVLMDVQMPVLDGVEATRRIRKMPPPLGSVPIIGLTANVMAREREQYLAAGMNACLGKPIEWPQLHAAIRQLASGEKVAAVDARPETDVGTALLDDGTLHELRQLFGDDLEQLLQAGISGYERYLQNMEAPGAAAADLRTDAHKVKGSAGTLGLLAIHGHAAAIEDAAATGQTPMELVRALRHAVLASRAELAQRGWTKKD